MSLRHLHRSRSTAKRVLLARKHLLRQGLNLSPPYSTHRAKSLLTELEPEGTIRSRSSW